MQPLSPLHRAAQRGEVEELRRLVQKVAMTRRIAVAMRDAFPHWKIKLFRHFHITALYQPPTTAAAIDE